MASDPYGSHEPVLKALAPISRRVLELGGGLYSTTLFLTNPLLRTLVTVEDDPEWRTRLSMDHPKHLLPDSTALDYVASSPLGFDVILIDNATDMGERAKTIRAVAARKPRAVVVVHDYEHYLYRDAASAFKNKWVYDKAEPWTGVVWNENCRHRESRIRFLLANA